jgi:DnaJ-class molecular chaperone
MADIRKCDDCDGEGDVLRHRDGGIHPLSFDVTMAWPSMDVNAKDQYRSELERVSCPACHGTGSVAEIIEEQNDG